MKLPPALQGLVVVVGPGRLGRSVEARLREKGHDVVLIGRSAAIPPAPLTYLTVPDGAIGAAAAAVPPGGVLLHASGATAVEALRPHPCAGSLHPLMTFPGPDKAPWPEGPVPAAIDGDPMAQAAAQDLAAALGFSAFSIAGDRRLYHAAAVLSGNFATTLLAAGAALLEALGVSAAEAPGLLLPLARASLENAARVGPAAALTGPVARGDEAVLVGHQEAIAAAVPDLLPLYQALLQTSRDRLGPPRH